MMADEIKLIPPKEESKSGSSDIEIVPPRSDIERGFAQAGRGLLESIPFTGEALAEKAGLPKPETFPERLTRRSFRNLPYGAAGMVVNPLIGGLGYLGATGLGQVAEEVGVPESYQPLFEIAGGSLPSAGRAIAGKTAGYIEPALETLYKKGKGIFELGPGARSSIGMKYGTGETEQSAIRNLNKFTAEASTRAGNPVSFEKGGRGIDAGWIKDTGKLLGNEVNSIFQGKTFISNPKFIDEVTNLSHSAEGAFGQQGNVVKNILEKNIGGKRPGGALVSPQFDAQDLRAAIIEVNDRLSGASPNEAKLLYQLKNSLEDVAADNLKLYGGDLLSRYDKWRKEYNAFASIRDVFQRAGESGVTAAGQLNPKTTLDVLKMRTAGNPAGNALYDNLAEYGQIMQAQAMPRKGLTKAITEILPESTLSKALQTTLQPRVESKLAGRLRAAQAVSPAQQYLQYKPEEIELIEPRKK